MSFIDGSVVNLALPSLQVEMNATLADVQWVVEAYLIVLGALLLVGGALGDRYGRRTIYVVGVSVFTTFSMACGMAQSLPQLVWARVLQGVGAALLVPGSLAILSDVYDNKIERSQAIAVWSAFSSVTTAIGPVLGGYLVQHWSWRWAFLVNLPIGMLVVALLLAFLPSSRTADTATGLDWPGALAATLGLAATVYGLIAAGSAEWSRLSVWLPICIGTALLVVFWGVESRSPHPMLPLTLFRSPAFSAANGLTLLLYTALSGIFFFLPLDLIQVQGFSPAQAGAATLPFVVCMVLLSTRAGRLAERYGSRLPLTLGPALAAVGCFMFTRVVPHSAYWAVIFPAVAVLGTGMAMTVAPLTATVMGSVDNQWFGVASGVNNAVSRVGSMMAVAALGLVMAVGFHRSIELRLSGLPLASAQQIVTHEDRLAAIPLEDTASREAVFGAFTDGFRDVCVTCAALALASAIIACAGLRTPRPRD